MFSSLKKYYTPALACSVLWIDFVFSVIWDRPLIPSLHVLVFAIVLTYVLLAYIAKKDIILSTTTDEWRQAKLVGIATAFFSIASTFIFIQVSELHWPKLLEAIHKFMCKMRVLSVSQYNCIAVPLCD